MIENICTILLLIQLFACSGFAQQALPKITPVAVGDQLPKTFWNFKHVLLKPGVPREYALSNDKGGARNNRFLGQSKRFLPETL